MNADIHTLTGAYALNAVSEAERAAFEEHLDQCAPCRKEVAELQETAARLGGAVAEPPPDSLKSQVIDRIREVRQPPSDGTVVAWRSRRWPIRVTTAAAAAAVIAAVVLGGQAIRTDRNLEQAQQELGELRENSQEVAEVLSAADAKLVSGGDDVSGAVVFSSDEGKLAFVPRQVPEPPSDKTYQLWLVGPEGARSAGLMTDPSSPVVVTGLGDAENFGITIEPEGGSQQPTSDPLLLLALS